MSNPVHIAVIGGGIAGLGFALHLKRKGISCEVFEAVPDVKEIGVGITLLPHAMRELAALGLQDKLEAAAIENLESVFFNRYGQFVYSEPRGRHAGYPLPELGIHRGRLHRILFDEALAQLGADKVHTGYRCTGVEQDDNGVTVHFNDAAGVARPPVRADIVVACDGVRSAVRKQFYPDEKMAFAGINTWRGVTRHKPILTGKSYIRIGTIDTGKMVVYPIIDSLDENGMQLINWTTEIQGDTEQMNDWNQSGKASDFAETYQDWRFPWLDVPALIANSEEILEYPMVDRDPIPQWTFGRVTLMGDAAHPMYPRGSNGSAQALIDGRVLSEQLQANPDALLALEKYQALRLETTANIVRTNRAVPPDFIIMKANELSGGKPFSHIDDLISQEELRKIAENYANIAGFSQAALKASGPV